MNLKLILFLCGFIGMIIYWILNKNTKNIMRGFFIGTLFHVPVFLLILKLTGKITIGVEWWDYLWNYLIIFSFWLLLEDVYNIDYMKNNEKNKPREDK